VEYGTVEAAVEAVKEGNAYGMLHIKSNFSMGLIDRGVYGLDAPSEVLEASSIEFRLDNTGKPA
jgi:hypothetical protein